MRRETSNSMQYIQKHSIMKYFSFNGCNQAFNLKTLNHFLYFTLKPGWISHSDTLVQSKLGTFRLSEKRLFLLLLLLLLTNTEEEILCAMISKCRLRKEPKLQMYESWINWQQMNNLFHKLSLCI